MAGATRATFHTLTASRFRKAPVAARAESLGIGQERVSRLEKRSDLLLSTLRSYVEAMGGNLQIVAQFPDRPPIVLTGLTAMGTHPAAARRGRRCN